MVIADCTTLHNGRRQHNKLSHRAWLELRKTRVTFTYALHFQTEKQSSGLTDKALRLYNTTLQRIYIAHSIQQGACVERLTAKAHSSSKVRCKMQWTAHSAQRSAASLKQRSRESSRKHSTPYQYNSKPRARHSGSARSICALPFDLPDDDDTATRVLPLRVSG